jgi:phosphoglycerol transferase
VRAFGGVISCQPGNPLNLSSLRRALLFYGGQAVVCALLLAAVVPFGRWSLRIPFDYAEDGLFFSVLVKAVAEEGPFHIERIGAPFGCDLVDWPVGMWLPLALTTGLTAALGDPGLSINLYWLLSLVGAGVTATWSLVRLSLPRGLAFVLGVLYAFLPYGFYRNVGHVNTLFPLVPLVALLALRVAGTHPERLTSGERRVLLGACLLQGLSYIYYAFFGCVLLLGGAALGWLRTRRGRLVRLAGAGVLLLSLGAAIPLVPSVAYWARHGANPALAYKSPGQADQYGLKVRHLLLPRADHPLGPLREIAQAVRDAEFPGENENTTAALGVIGSLGFLVLLGLLLGQAAGARRHFDEDLGPAAGLTLGAVLVAQVGGFGSLFSALVSPDIRAYNRIAVFVAFFSVYAAGILLRRAWARLPRGYREGTAPRAAALALLLGLGIADQVPVGALAAVRAETAPTFAEVDSFVAGLEEQLPPGAMVFQLPHQSIPVSTRARPPIELYDPGRAYFSSRSFRWSWGSMVGRTGDWQMLVARLPPARLVRTLALAGFSGVWLDRRAYPGEGAAARLEAALEEAASGRIQASAGGRYSFLDLRDHRRLLEVTLEPDILEAERLLALTPPFRIRWLEGCAEERVEVRSMWRQCGSRASAVLRNPLPSTVRARITGRLRAPGPGRLTLDAGGSVQILEVHGRAVPYQQDVAIAGGRPMALELRFDGPTCTEEGAAPCFEVVDLHALRLTSEGQDLAAS